ncbi:phage major capsid protein [Rhodococcus sp. SORGH_AS_0303]|uniref:phage major capsid protein n=1 Tax=Rhodococcus sp. SORGH_AS_0303 TaxID=3041753 RepID=UPI00278ABCD5|nr:phage major capsid protein [Rhodococcus sp. SORGH_AS_0303]MDQ1202718.1 HK97 family phage major capsid protein [Rhodococcus sp. SORGH_AS_0303]
MKISKMNLAELTAYITEARTEATELATRSDNLTGEDADRFDSLERDLNEAKTRKAQIEARAESVKNGFAAGAIGYEDGAPGGFKTERRDQKPSLKGALLLRKDESFSEWNRQNGHTEHAGISLDQILRGVGIGDWRGVDSEQRALVEGTQSAGGVLVPTPVAAQVIDVARAQARVIQAGATIVPMSAATLRIPRITNEGAAAFYSEGAQRSAQDIAFDAVTLTAKSYERLIILSKELFEDSDPSVGTVIENAFAAQFAAGLDLAALYGSGTGANPTGVVNTAGVTATAHGANGTALTNYDWLIAAAGAVRAANWDPTAHIVAPRTATNLALLKDSQGRYLDPPTSSLPVLTSTNVPVNLTVGSSSTASQIVTGDYRQVLIGLRSQFQIRTLTERYADSGQIAFLATMRLDVQVAHPSAFVVDSGIL